MGHLDFVYLVRGHLENPNGPLNEDEESRFSGDIGTLEFSLCTLLPLAISRSASSRSLAIIAFGAFEFIVPKY